MRRALRSAAGLLFLPAAAASAQRPALGAAFDPATRAAIQSIVDSARADGLPADALVNKALEGAGKHAAGPRIVGAVRMLYGELAASREALGAASRRDEVTAGAQALHAGAATPDLHALRLAAGRRPLGMPLMVLTDLMSRGVPPETAAGIMDSLVRAGARDADLVAFQRNVRLDVDRGAAPAAAATTRVRGALAALRSH
ncbi:MAG TPA: hypothetical protein VG818_05720 [Gemmatimonadaceae bacterium]|jgi:hypothetical protein|nr:hypothetical protein [Gemmatimonadaceae bacterium]